MSQSSAPQTFNAKLRDLVRAKPVRRDRNGSDWIETGSPNLSAVPCLHIPSGVSDNNLTGGHILRDDTARADHGPISHRYTREKDRAAANPDTLAETYRMRDFKPFHASFNRILMMLGAVNLHIRPKLALISDRYFSAIKNGATGIQKYILTKCDVDPVGAMERGFDNGLLRLDELFELWSDGTARLRRQTIVLMNSFPSGHPQRFKLIVDAGVPFARSHLLTFGFGHDTHLLRIAEASIERDRRSNQILLVDAETGFEQDSMYKVTNWLQVFDNII